MKYFIVLFLFIPFFIHAQVTSYRIMKSVYPDYDTVYFFQVDSFANGIHVSQLQTDSVFYPIQKTYYTWQNNLLLDSITLTYMNSSWTYYKETVNQYDANDSLLETNYFTFVYSGTTLIDTNFRRTTYVRDTVLNKITKINTYFNNMTWVTQDIRVDSLDAFDRVVYSIYSDTFPEYDYRYFYLSNDSVDYYLYRQMQGTYADTDSVVFQYYPGGSRSQETTYRFSTFNGYTPWWMISYVYDNSNNMTNLCNHLWMTSQWSCQSDTIAMTFNASNKLTRFESAVCGLGGGHDNNYFYNSNGDIDSIYFLGWGSMGSNYITWFTFQYFNVINNIDESTIGRVSVYPNPASNRITIKLRDSGKVISAKILDLKGSVVYHSLKPANEFSIDTQTLDPGIYFVQVAVADEIFSARISIFH